MNAQLEKEFNQLEAERKELLDELKQYSDEVLNKKPAPEKWSAAEVAGHLMSSEGKSLQYLQKKTLDTSRSGKAGLKPLLRLWLLQIAFALPLNFRAPKITHPEHEYLSLKEIDEKWTNIRKGIFEIISKLSDEELKKELWKHAIAGKLDIFNMVDFFGIHFRRHRKQIERTLAAVK